MAQQRLWGGNFSEAPAKVLSEFNDSFSFDRELLTEDVEGSAAWAEALRAAGVLTHKEKDTIVKALYEIAAEPVPADADDEDVHAYVEARLYKKTGPLAGKLHTGRSRNDQVATDLKLYLRSALSELTSLALGLSETLIQRAKTDAATPMPGYTHLKRAEPVTFGHWCLAYTEMLLRDAGRALAVRERGSECPLGSGALAGTPLPIDREALSSSLGFTRATANSLDAVSDRDLAAEYLFTATLLLIHLSRMAEDIIFFVSEECGFFLLPDSFSTGSSRMPHKKNPDIAELVRGHAGRAIGELTGLLAVIKGLPLAYDKDLQLDKEPVFRIRRTLRSALPAVNGLMANMGLNREAMRSAASTDRMLTTALADSIAGHLPFREAHEIAGKRLAESEQAGTSIRELGPSQNVLKTDLAAMDLEKALQRRKASGSTSPALVKKAAGKALQKVLKLRRQL